MKRVLLALLVLVAACPQGNPKEKVRVLAAASLAAPLTALAAAYEARNPGVTVELSFGSSTAHERQIEAGAAWDLYVAASRANTERLASKGLIDSATVIARNTLVAIVPRGGAVPAGIPSLAALPRVAVGARGVPVGEYARSALSKIVPEDRFMGYPDEPSVLVAIAEGAAPCGICYGSSLVSHPRRADVTRAFTIETPEPIVYPAALARDAHAPARAFLEFLRSSEGREALAKNGFSE